jgi:glycosyltransferase involved in cell wall biosynthesis
MRILWIPHTGWHIPQRAHHFCQSLSERHEIHVTDLVADFTGLGDYLSPRYARNFLYRRYRDGAIHVHGVPRISPALFSDRLRQFNNRLFNGLVRWLIRRYRIDVVVGSFVVAPPQAPRLVFDLFDENVAAWRAAGFRSYADEIDQIETLYLRTADAVVVAGAVLAEKARATRLAGPLYIIPNGVHVARFGSQGRAETRAALGLKGIVAGSVGNHDRAEELDRLLEVARLLAAEALTVVIAGRGAALGAARQRAERERISNVRFLDYIPLANLPGLLAALDVGLCPYTSSPMDDARCPMRLLAYCAAGLPTVCTDLEEVRRMAFPNVLLVNDTAAALAAGVQQARTMGRARPATIERYDLRRLAAHYEAVCTGTATADNQEGF